MPESPLKNVGLIINPKAGKNLGRQYGKIAESHLNARGIFVKSFQTTHGGHATSLCQELTDRMDAVFAVGGDGTLTEVVRGLKGNEHVPVGIIPVGTANVVAREMRIPLKNPQAAVDAALSGVPTPMDLPYANGEPFLANVGAGFDADVVHALHQHRQSLPNKKSISMASYVPIGLNSIKRHKPGTITVVLDGQLIEGAFADVVVCNTANYGGIMSLTPKASCSDGLLDIYLRRRAGRLGILRHLASAQFRWKDQGAVQRLQGKHVRIEADPQVSLQIDGDPAGYSPVEIQLGSKQVQILSPGQTRQ